MKNKYRTHNCSELSEKDINKTIILSGWLHRKRDHGNLLFIDLRDHFGITQCVIENDNQHFSTLEKLKPESVLKVIGKVVQRTEGTENKDLKTGKIDDRIQFLNKLKSMTPNVKFDLYGIDKVQPIWADHYFKTISNAKMGLNLSRGEPIKYYSSDRITQIIGNGLVTLIDEKTHYRDFFNDQEMVFYKNVSDLAEKILKISKDEKLRKEIGRKGKKKYLKFFNSTEVAKYLIKKTFDSDNNNKKKFYWE